MTGPASYVAPLTLALAPLTLALAALLWPSSHCLAMTATGGPGHSRDDFNYFAYGSNLLRGRLLLQNPTAVQVSVGCLKVRERGWWESPDEFHCPSD